MKWIVLAAIVGLGSPSQGLAKQGGLKAHQHGVANLNIATDGNTAMVEIEVPGEAIFGFEHRARTTEDKQTQQTALKKLHDGALEVVSFAVDLKCEATSITLDTHYDDHDDHDDGHGHKKHKHEKKHKHGHDKKHKHGKKHGHGKKKVEHSEVRGKFHISCNGPIAGTEATVGLSRLFPKIHRIKIQLLTEKKQQGLTLTKGRAVLKL